MKTALKTALSLALVLALATAGLAADQEKKKKKQPGKTAAPQAINAVSKMVESLDLTDVQKQQIKDLQTRYEPKLAAAAEKAAAAIPDEVKRARAEAAKKARQEGKKGKELQEAVAASAGISDDDLAKIKAAQVEVRSLQQELKAAVLAVLTDDQKAKLPQPERGKKKEKK